MRAAPRAVRLLAGLLPLALAVLLSASAAPRAAEEGGDKPKANGPVYVKLPPIVLPVVAGGRVVRQAALTLDLELAKGRTAAEIQPKQPVLYDAFITELYTIFDQNGGAEHLIDPVVIKDRLQQISDRILGSGIVVRVLIEQAMERGRPPG